MEVVSQGGVEYTKVTVLAEEFGYTTDYIGQLCRAKKVNARLVGRAWYVERTSLVAHKKARYKADASKDAAESELDSSEPIIRKNYNNRLDVEPVLRNRAVKIIKNINGSAKAVSVRYEEDNQALIPEVQKVTVEKEVPIKLADAEPVFIRLKTAPETTLKPDPVPKVYLQGKLMVSDVPEKTSIAIKPAHREGSTVQSKRLAPVLTKQTATIKPVFKSEKNVVNPSHIGKRSLRPQRQVPMTTAIEGSFAPASVKTQKQMGQISGYEESRTPYALAIFFAFLLAIVTSTALLTVEINIEVAKGESVQKISFQPATLIEFLPSHLRF
jgi:hypothetical protein